MNLSNTFEEESAVKLAKEIPQKFLSRRHAFTQCSPLYNEALFFSNGTSMTKSQIELWS